jgi:WD40 repeat protein
VLFIVQICTARVFAQPVLIAGGDETAGPTPFVFISTAELYDPKSGTFTRTTGNMNITHFGSHATLLRDGRVLFTGGSNGDFPAEDDGELYDPKTQSFTDLGVESRDAFVSELLKNGKVLVAGGDGCCLAHPILDDAELFDPKSNSFTATGSMTIHRTEAHSAELENGQVLAAGGFTGNSFLEGAEITSSAELYDPKRGTFSPTGNLLTATTGGSATLLKNGKVLIAGGIGTNNVGTNAAELYDPKTGQFTATGNMLVTRTDSYTATLLKNGQVLIAGGTDSANMRIDSAELYNRKTGQFTATGNLTTPRAGHTATLLSSGDVLLVSGDAFGNTAELYHPKTGTFSATGDLTTARPFGLSATLLGH